jgi:hypothetical protein
VADAAHRRAASELSVRRQPDAARSAGNRGGGRPPARPDADARMGIEAHLSPAQHLQARARPQGFTPICCAAWRSRGPTRSGRWTSPTSPWRAASSIWPRWSTGSAAACWHGSCRSPWRLPSASRRWKKLFPRMKNRRSSTPTRAAVHQRSLHRAAKKRRDQRSAWTARAAGATTSSSSGSGSRSSTKRSTCMPTPRSARPGTRSAATSSSTTPSARTPA